MLTRFGERLSIFIAIPAYGGNVTTGCLSSVFDLQATLRDIDIDVMLCTVDNTSVVPLARNILAARFLETSCTHLFFVDADMEFRSQDVVRMLDHLDASIVAGLYPKKEIDWARIKTVAARGSGDAGLLDEIVGNFSGMFEASAQANAIDLNQPFEVDRVATGLMLISRECFVGLRHHGVTKVLAPVRDRHVTAGVTMDVFFDYEIDGDRYVIEDFTFCKRVKAMGGTILACPWFVTSHIGQFRFRGSLFAIAAAMRGAV